MNILKEEVINLLYQGISPLVIGFQDDGLYYLFDKLLQGRPKSTGYDPTTTFVHITLNYLSNINVNSIENEINKELLEDNFEGDNIPETLLNVDFVTCVVDDLASCENVPLAIESCDNLIKRYRNRVRFVYIAEDPLIIEKNLHKISAHSSFFEAELYQRIGVSWDIENLKSIMLNDYKVSLNESEIQEITKLSNNHFGTFKRLYKDKSLNLITANRYISLLAETFKPEELNALKKLQKNLPLEDAEQNIISAFTKVNLVQSNKITIPLLNDYIQGNVVVNKIQLQEQRLVGLDLNLLTQTERSLIQEMLTTEEPVSKERVGEIIWKDKVNDKFSIWAVDQRIARLRRKLMDLGFDIDIQSIYGKGFKIVRIPKL